MTTAEQPDSPALEIPYGRRLTEIAAQKPDAIDLTVVAADGSETGVDWATLERRANQLARALTAKGVDSGDLVGLALPSCIDHVLVTLAIWKLGATLLPLRHDQPQWEMDRLLEMGSPKLLISDQHTASCPVLTTADLAATTDLDGGTLPEKLSETTHLVASSGSTGKPKLIVSPLKGAVMYNPVEDLLVDANEAAVILVTSPLYHVNGFSFVAPRLLESSRVVLMEKFDAALAVDLIERHQVTYCVMVPTMLQRIARQPTATPDRFRSIRRVIYGGSTIPEWVVERWLELVGPSTFTLTYGSSERLGLVAMTGDEWADHRGSTGRPLDVEISIRDDSGQELPIGEVGELWMRPTDPDRRLFSYIGMPTPQATQDGFRTIGDMARVDEEGYVYIADRRKDMIITGGANVFPAEVEAALSEHPDVVDQVVVGVEDDEWGKRVHAIIQPADLDHPPTAEALRAWCKQHLASYKVPKTYEVIDRIPRTAAGKLNRTDLGDARKG